MRRYLWLVCLLLPAMAPPAAAQGLLPSSFGDWSAQQPPSFISPNRFDQLLGANAPVFREFALQSVEHQIYERAGETATVSLYKLRDPSAAYGAYTLLRSDTTPPIELGSFGSASLNHALIVIGNFLLEADAVRARPTNQELQQVVQTIEKVSDRAPFPPIFRYLPEQGRVRRSEHYVIGPVGLGQQLPLGSGDWVGFDRGAEAIVSKYRLDGTEAKLLLIAYPTQQIAAELLGGMLRRFTFDPPGEPPPGETVLFGKRVSSMVAVVVGAPNRDSANALLDQVDYGTQVTWDEPTHSLTEPNISVMIVGAFVGTGAIMLLALAAGLGFGGLRLLVKLIFPNKVFDREKQVEILQLGISSKPIRAKDFY